MYDETAKAAEWTEQAEPVRESPIGTLVETLLKRTTALEMTFDEMGKSEEAAIRQAAAWEFMARRAELARDKAVARAEAAEAKLDEQIEAAIALRHDLDTLRDLYGAAEARITAATNECNRMIEAFVFARDGRPNEAGYYAFQSVRAALVEPVGEPPRPTPEETAAMDALVAESERLGLYRENYLTWDALRADVERLNRAVGEPQPPTCATCGGTGVLPEPENPESWEDVAAPCPSCAPTEPGDPT